jgi:hypothetical protein
MKLPGRKFWVLRCGAVSADFIHFPRYFNCALFGGNYLQVCEKKIANLEWNQGNRTNVFGSQIHRFTPPRRG